MDIEKILHSAFTHFFALTTLSSVLLTTDALAANKIEKCYGIVKAGFNDCQTATASCASSSTKDNQSDAFIFLPVGTCNKLVGGHLTPPSPSKSEK